MGQPMNDPKEGNNKDISGMIAIKCIKRDGTQGWRGGAKKKQRAEEGSRSS